MILCGCSSFKAQPLAGDLPEAYVEQRIEAVAKNLVDEGQAANMDEARPMAEKIVRKEIADQKHASRVNEDQSRFYNVPNTRVEGE